jgi:hypothetical protein
MAINFKTGAHIDRVNLKAARRPTPEIAMTRALGGIPEAGSLTGIELRLKKVFIKDNGTAEIWFLQRYSDLYVLMAIIDDLGGAPQTVQIEGFAGVDDNEVLPVERTAYYWKESTKTPTAPGQVHIVLSIVKSNSGVRNLGKALSTLQKSDDYKTIVTTLIETVASGGTKLVTDSLLALTGVLGSLLGDVEDTPLITQVLSFTDIGGELTQIGTNSFHRENRYVDLDMALIIRDANREKAISLNDMRVMMPAAVRSRKSKRV